MDTTVNIQELQAQLEQALAENRSLRRSKEKFGLTFKRHPEQGEAQKLRKGEVPFLVKNNDLSVIKEDPQRGEHLLLEGDNLSALVAMQATHKGKVDVIYIDPPYNTGNNDFVYNDRYVSNDDGFRHSKWLSFMERRLILAKELLSETGVIFVSIDDNEQAALKILMDSVFGADNFISPIIRATNSTKNNSRFVSINHEYCFVYAVNKITLNETMTSKWTVAKNNSGEYYKRAKQLVATGAVPEEIERELKELTKYPRFTDMTNYWYFDDRGLYAKADLGGVKNGNTIPIINSLTGLTDPVPPGGFRYSPDKMKQLVDESRIHFHQDGSLPRLKRYLHENLEQNPKSIMSDDQRPDNSLLKSLGIEFDNPKQMAFMQRILGIFSSDAIVLDFFAGSGTTGHAVAALNAEDGGNRQAILVTNNFEQDGSENSIARDVTAARMKAVLTGEWADGKPHDALPGNLHYYKIDFRGREESEMGESVAWGNHAYAGIAALSNNTHINVTPDTLPGCVKLSSFIDAGQVTVLRSNEDAVFVWSDFEFLMLEDDEVEIAVQEFLAYSSDNGLSPRFFVCSEEANDDTVPGGYLFSGGTTTQAFPLPYLNQVQASVKPLISQGMLTAFEEPADDAEKGDEGIALDLNDWGW